MVYGLGMQGAGNGKRPGSYRKAERASMGWLALKASPLPVGTVMKCVSLIHMRIGMDTWDCLII